jgi:hypothetical protein
MMAFYRFALLDFVPALASMEWVLPTTEHWAACIALVLELV